MFLSDSPNVIKERCSNQELISGELVSKELQYATTEVVSIFTPDTTLHTEYKGNESY